MTDILSPVDNVDTPCPEGADLAFWAKAHDQSVWDDHPEVERYRVIITPEHPDADWQVLIWTKPPTEEQARPAAEISSTPPDRPADLDLRFDAQEDGAFFLRCPGVAARQFDLQLNEHANGAERRLKLWLSTRSSL